MIKEIANYKNFREEKNQTLIGNISQKDLDGK